MGWFLVDCSNTRAVPWKLPWIVVGTPIRTSSCITASRAWESETPSARLNDTVVAGNVPWCATESGVFVIS